jgi:fructan beta-fructosidase
MCYSSHLICCFLASLFSLAGAPMPRPDVLVADFEGNDYGDWKTTGEAFGKGPARGTLPNQMPVTGFLGKGLVNSYLGGDKTTGTLTSPPFKLERKHLNFLIGGGKDRDKTCMKLLVDGKTVRVATGPNDKDGGSEHLDWQSWDVAEFAGMMAVIEIVDHATGGWGHICVDHIVQSDRRKQLETVSREWTITKRYLLLPVKTGATLRKMHFVVDNKNAREFEIELADGDASFWTFSDVSAFKGQKLRIVTTLFSGSTALDAIEQSDEIKGTERLYQERHRPQFHFTSRRGWLNDPNGMVFFKGEYHLFYQHNPFGWNWGNMHWGHAVSKDLVHWEELPIALYPRKFGDWAFSGSAVVDHADTSGFGKGNGSPLIAAFTTTGRGECIVFSNDLGRTWTEYEGNPVVKHVGRDPKLVWHAASKQWVMAVYEERDRKQWISFHTSPDLKKWTFRSRIDGYYECPDLFEIAIDGKDGAKKWVLYAADGKYVFGDFDGAKFTVESGKHQLWHGNFYAAQTFSDTVDNRRIQIGWGTGITFPGMPFNQQMTVPVQLTLRTTAKGVRMFAEPVKELEALRGEKHAWNDVALKPGLNPLAKIKGEQFDLRAEISVGDADSVGFHLRGVSVVYDGKKQQITCKGVTAPLPLVDGKIRLRLLQDRGSIEVFGNDGAMAMSVAAIPAETSTGLEVFSRGGVATIHELEVFEMKSAWR